MAFENGKKVVGMRAVEALVLAAVVLISFYGPRWLERNEQQPLTQAEVEALKERTLEDRKRADADREKIRAEWRSFRHERLQRDRELNATMGKLADVVTDLRIEMQHFRSIVPFISPESRPNSAPPSRASEDEWRG